MTNPLNDLIIWALGGAASALATLGVPLGTTVKRNRDRSIRNARALDGTGPNDEGLRKIAFDTRERVEFLDEKFDDFRQEVTREHGEVMTQLESMDDND